MIQVKNITFSYPGTRRNVFSDFSLELKENNIYGLLGKNGTGKSTLLYLISGLLRAKNGEVVVDGVNSNDRNPNIQKDIFIVPEEFDMPSITLDMYVKLMEPFYPNFSRDLLENCLKDFELPHFHKLNELSMGQKKKVFMSFALASGTRIMLMDEPTNGLDIPSKTQFRKVIANNMSDDRILIISTHQVHDVESLLDHVVVIGDGHTLLDASMAELSGSYRFEVRKPGDDVNDALYVEHSLQGNAVVAPRREGDDETSVNLELLFSAVAEGRLGTGK